MSKTLEDLRERLFDAIDGVKSGKLPVDKARAINDLGQAIINSAKVEVDYLRVSADKKSRFLGAAAPALPAPSGEGRRRRLQLRHCRPASLACGVI